MTKLPTPNSLNNPDDNLTTPLLKTDGYEDIFLHIHDFFNKLCNIELNKILFKLNENKYLKINNQEEQLTINLNNDFYPFLKPGYLRLPDNISKHYFSIAPASIYVFSTDNRFLLILVFKNNYELSIEKKIIENAGLISPLIYSSINRITLNMELNSCNRKIDKNSFVLNAIEELNQSLIGASNLKKISHIFLLTVTGYLTSSSACFYLKVSGEKDFFRLINFTGNLPNPSQSLMVDDHFFPKNGINILSIDEISQPKLKSSLLKNMAGTIFFFSTASDEKITGICTIGTKFNNEQIREDEKKLVSLMIQQIMAPIKNAFFYEQLEKQNKFLLETNRLLKNEMMERKNAEEKEAKTNWKFKTIIETAKEGFLELNNNNYITNLNLQMSIILQDSKENLIGQNILDFIEPGFNNLDYLDKASLTTRGRSFEASIIGKNKKKTDCLINITPLPDINFNIKDTTSIFAMVTDISELKDKEKKLIEYKNIISVSSDIIALISSDYSVTPINDPGKDFFFHGDIDNPKIHDFFDKDVFQNNLRQRIIQTSKGEVTHTRIWLKTFKMDSKKFYDLILYPYENDENNKEFSSIILIMRDISKLKEMEMRLLQTQKMEAVGTLAGGIAHDFNNILSGIIGYTELAALKSKNDEGIKAYLDKILDAGHRATDLIRQILSFSRKGINETERKPVLVIPVLKEVIKLLQASLPSTIDIKTIFDDKRLRVNTNPTHLHQIVMNICTNAAHAMEEEGGTLEVRAGSFNINHENNYKFPELKKGDYFTIEIKDTGEGIPPSNMERIFEPFFTTKPPGKGTGMGLAVAHNIIKSMEGTITISSILKKGSVFTVYLPIIVETKTDADTNLAPNKEVIGGNEHILLVDDEKILVDMTSIILKELGYKVTAFTSSYEALEFFKENHKLFDLAILDQTMPKLTGIKLSIELSKIRDNFPVILSSGYSEDEYKEKLKKANIRSFVMKPLERTKLAQEIRKVLL